MPQRRGPPPESFVIGGRASTSGAKQFRKRTEQGEGLGKDKAVECCRCHVV